MPSTANDLASAADALRNGSMAEIHWRTIEDALEELRTSYQFFEQSASYCFDAGWPDALKENEQRLEALSSKIETLVGARDDPSRAVVTLLSLAKVIL